MLPIPFNDQYRLEELNASQILDTEQDPFLDHLTSLARRQFGAPIALVTLVDKTRQWFKSVQGLNITETPRNMAFCAHAIMSEMPMIVLDATLDERFSQNPLVTEEPKIRFYAGAPLISSNGYGLGTFCVIDSVAREAFSKEDEEALEQFAAVTVRLVEQGQSPDHIRRTVSPDSITEDAFTDLFSYLAHEIRSPLANIGAVSRAFAMEAFGRLGNDQYKEFACKLGESSVHIMEILDRMLEFGRMAHGDVKTRDEALAISDVFANVVRHISQTHPQHIVDIASASEIDNIRLNADKTFVVQMLQNLVDNACKYGGEASPVRLASRVLDSGELALVVEDRGYGLTTEEAKLALRPYRRVIRQVQNSPKGIGIGLSLVKRLVELHGGTIALEPRRDGGTRVSLVFPAYRVKYLHNT